MPGSTFRTNPIDLDKLINDCDSGILQLPDFQRSWVWDEDRIKSLIASISRAFPIGALMTLDIGGEVNFKPRPIEGTPAETKNKEPLRLLLDGQQRMTSLYQVTIRDKVVKTETANKKKVKRWFYFDIRKALDLSKDRDEAVIGIGEDRILRRSISRDVLLDLSDPEKEYANLMFPVTKVFDWDRWQDGFNEYWEGDENKSIREEFKKFKREILENFKYYKVPVIALENSNTKEAICVVFEKVNTGGKALDAFELVTAMYSAEGHELRKDWYGNDEQIGRHRLFVGTLCAPGLNSGILAKVGNTDFLHATSLFYTRDNRRLAEADGKSGKELPAVSGNRKAILNLPLKAYKQYQDQVEQGFIRAAKFLNLLHIYKVKDLPYQSQIISLAAILADIGDAWEHEANRAKLVKWYWNGVFGELYSSAVDSRIAKDFLEVPVWLKGGQEPSTVSDTMFRADRLKTMRMRLSAAYKGVNALLMQEGVQDFRSGQKFDHTVFFGENVDIHHIFPKDWCKKHYFQPAVYDSIINKTPLSYKTNRILGGIAPSEYLAKLQNGDEKTPSIDPGTLDGYLSSHLINHDLLRSDDFPEFMKDRQKRLLALIEKAMGKTAYTGNSLEEGENNEVDDDILEAEHTLQ